MTLAIQGVEDVKPLSTLRPAQRTVLAENVLRDADEVYLVVSENWLVNLVLFLLPNILHIVKTDFFFAICLIFFCICFEIK